MPLVAPPWRTALHRGRPGPLVSAAVTARNSLPRRSASPPRRWPRPALRRHPRGAAGTAPRRTSALPAAACLARHEAAWRARLAQAGAAGQRQRASAGPPGQCARHSRLSPLRPTGAWEWRRLGNASASQWLWRRGRRRRRLTAEPTAGVAAVGRRRRWRRGHAAGRRRRRVWPYARRAKARWRRRKQWRQPAQGRPSRGQTRGLAMPQPAVPLRAQLRREAEMLQVRRGAASGHGRRTRGRQWAQPAAVRRPCWGGRGAPYVVHVLGKEGPHGPAGAHPQASRLQPGREGRSGACAARSWGQADGRGGRRACGQRASGMGRQSAPGGGGDGCGPGALQCGSRGGAVALGGKWSHLACAEKALG